MTAPDLGPALDARRSRVATDGLTSQAVAALTPVVRALPVKALTPVKQHLKRFFSTAPWTEADDAALAAVVGPGAGSEQVVLAPDLLLTWGWVGDRFRVRLVDRPATDG